MSKKRVIEEQDHKLSEDTEVRCDLCPSIMKYNSLRTHCNLVYGTHYSPGNISYLSSIKK